MDDIARRVAKCFQAVFPGMREQDIPAASTASIQAWDSVATVTLGNVIEEEFGAQMDFDRLLELDSFDHIVQWVRSEVPNSKS